MPPPSVLPPAPRRVLLAHGVPGLADALAGAVPGLQVRERRPAEIAAADLEWAEALVGFRRPTTDGWGNVRWIHSIGAGVDAFLFRTGLPASILVTRSSEDFGPSIGEYVLARMLAVTQHLAHFAGAQRERRWAPRDPESPGGSRALVLGTGLVGQGVARALLAIGVRCDGLSRSGRPVAPFGRVGTLDRFDELVRGARWLVLAAPLTEATWRLLDRDRLARCGGAYLINVGRGGLVEEAALPEALDAGWLAGAALDVFEQEPLDPGSPLWGRADVTCSPHIAGITSREGALEGFLDCHAALARGERPRWAVDREAGY